MENRMQETLPLHAPDAEEQQPAVRASGAICIGGQVARPLVLTPAVLAQLSRVEHVETFRCEEGWSVPRLRWSGVRLADVIQLASPLPAAPYVLVCAGSYSMQLTPEEVQQALLCDRLNDAPLSPEHGAPWRLLLPGGKCFTSVKWVSELLVGAAPAPSTAEERARRRRTAT
jgi:DMSO/TMAO reductase YedYZ molybdopterin-dependent catalytic subunit